jgi:Xaa-Pro aminopeptidase
MRPVDGTGVLVQVDLGLLLDGYEGGLGRTVSRDRRPSTARSDPATAGEHLRRHERSPEVAGEEAVVALQRRVLDACRPGGTADDLRAAAAGAASWMVRGSGMGFEAPVVTDTVGQAVVIQAGMVLSVEVAIDGWWRRDLAVVGPDGAQVL